MRAVVKAAADRGVEYVADAPEPKAGDGAVVVEIAAASLCGTDRECYEWSPAAQAFNLGLPVVLGHEVAGIVAAIGPDVAQICVGDHVVGSLAQSCGACARCLSGRSFQCRHPESTVRRPTDAPRLSRNGAGLFQGFGLGGFGEQALVQDGRAQGASIRSGRVARLWRCNGRRLSLEYG